MLASGLKYELDALANKDFRYLTGTYLPRNLKRGRVAGLARVIEFASARTRPMAAPTATSLAPKPYGHSRLTRRAPALRFVCSCAG